MRTSDLRQKVIRRIQRFAITEEEIDDLIHAGEYSYDPDHNPGEPYATLECMIRLLPEQKRHDLMCLMYLGRNLEYNGLCQETVDDFCAYADEKVGGNCSGSTDPEYLAGKARIARWLRLVKKKIRPDFWYIGTRYDGDVRLREINADDADFMMQLVSDPKVTRFIPGMIQDREMLISWIQSLGTTDHEYIVEIEGTDELIGECSLTEQGENGEIGFMLLPKYWHQRYGTEAVNSLIDKAQAMKIKELMATTDERNTAAIRLLRSCGFIKEKSGWMVMLSESEGDVAGNGQTINQFRKSI